MAARCFQDSCSIKWSEVTTMSGQAYNASLELAENGSIKCSDDEILGVGTGLFVDLLNDTPADTLRPCANILRRTTAGELYALLPQVVRVASVNSGYAAVPAAADASSPANASLAFAYENDSGCDQMVIMRGQFNVAWDVLAESAITPVIPGALRRITNITTEATAAPAVQASITPFNAQWITRLRRGITGPGAVANAPVVAQHFSTSGVVFDNVSSNTLKSEWRDFTWIEEVRDGATITFTADVFFDGPDQTINVAASPGADTPARGYRVHNCDLFALPLSVA